MPKRPEVEASLDFPGVPASFWGLWLTTATVTFILLLLAARTDRFPFDLPLARLLQDLTPSDRTWASLVTETGKLPLAYALGGLATLAAFRLVGWRGLLVGPAAYALASGADFLLKPWIARPRPSAQLITVMGSTAGYSCPSTHAMIYVATFGLVAWLCLRFATGARRWLVFTVCALCLLAGGAARVALGGHWPSDILLSWLLGGLLVTALTHAALDPRH